LANLLATKTFSVVECFRCIVTRKKLYIANRKLGGIRASLKEEGEPTRAKKKRAG